MANVIVLGAGLVGGIIAKDLALTHNVTCVDISQENLKKLKNSNYLFRYYKYNKNLQIISIRF